MNSPSSRIGATRVLLLLCFAGGFVGAHAAPAAADAGPKTHVLFMGADIDLKRDNGFYQVQDVAGGDFVVKVDGRAVKIPTKFASVDMKLKHELKLTDISVQVDKLTVERAYTPGNDPTRKFAASLAASANDAAVSSSAQQMVATRNAAQSSANATGPYANLGAGPYQPDYAGQARDSFQNFNSSVAAAGSDLNSAGYGAGKMQQELAEEAYDAIELKFEISSARPLLHPYAIIVAQFRATDDKPGEVHNWIYATELEPITAEMHRVHIKQGGFPHGFELKNSQLHLYDRGQEVATSVAPKRVELTRDEAFDYVVLEYLATNKGKTVPATLAMGHLPAALRNSLGRPQLFLRVDAAGLPGATFADEACTQPVSDAALLAAVGTLRFKPALDHGKPVAGVARLNL